MAQKPEEIIVKKGENDVCYGQTTANQLAGHTVELYFLPTKPAGRIMRRYKVEIFDYVYAIIGKFGLKIYQAPSGLDLCRLDP